MLRACFSAVRTAPAAAILLLSMLLASHSALAVEPVYTGGWFNAAAIRGYDPVAYHTEQRPVKGSSDYQHQWNGATWHFSSMDNRDRFAADPERYAPQYGGYCAWAVSQGYTAAIDPNAWRIVDDKLYLNYSKSVQATWEGDIAGNIAKGDNNWPRLLAE